MDAGDAGSVDARLHRRARPPAAGPAVKCIYCGTDSKYTERSGGRCQCGKKFAFEPKTGDRFTDAGFKSAIDAVSVQGQVRWGVEHLYYELCRRS